MDINALLSPADAPSRNETVPSPVQPPQQAGRKRLRPDGKRVPSTLSNEVIMSPPSAEIARSVPFDFSRHGTPGDAVRSVSDDRDVSPFGLTRPSVERHDQSAQHDSTSRSPAVAKARLIPPPNLRTHSASDLVMAEAPAQTPVSRVYTDTFLSDEDADTVTALTEKLAEHSYDYTSHVSLINLLHRGFLSHCEQSASPSDYALLADLRQARHAMISRFAIGEILWNDWIADESTLATQAEDYSNVIDLCARAVIEEPLSTVLWTLYGEWVWSTYCLANDLSHERPLSEDDKLICKELVTRELVLSVWRNAVAATKWRLDTSHIIWNRYTQITMQDFPDHPPSDILEEGRSLYMTRLQVPHAAWEDTLQSMFWPFLSKHSPQEWEEILAATKDMAAPAKQAYSQRATHEDRLQRASDSGNQTELYAAFSAYLHWERKYRKKTSSYDSDLHVALFERALLAFPTTIEWWLDYIDYRHSLKHNPQSLSPLMERASRHCPWSGDLWSARMLQAEIEGKSFNELESINLKANNCGLIETGGLEEMLKVHASWCNYLRRRAFGPHSTEDNFDMAEAGIPQVIEGFQYTARKIVGNDFQGDPSWRLEKILIEFLTRARRTTDARTVWQSLVSAQAHSYEFWIRYYNWELSVWSAERTLAGPSEDTAVSAPHHACEVLKIAFDQESLDWPEKIHEMYAYHFYTHHTPQEIQQAEIDMRKAQKKLRWKRERAVADAAAVQPVPIEDVETEASMSKRKRDDELTEPDAVKRNRVEQEPSQDPMEASTKPKRDREHNTASVRGLPVDIEEKQIRQFFSDCGTILSVAITVNTNDSTASCTVEFASRDDVLTARTKDGKDLGGHRIRVSSGAMSTLYVANYPDEYDEKKIHDMFISYGTIVKIRFPSLKFDKRRRFCYVQFLTDEEARAATVMDDTAIDGQHRLVAKIADPSAKANRTGALAEGREVRVANVDFKTSEQEIRELLQQHGAIEDIRLLKNVNGKFKGTAFVVFSSAVSSSRVLSTSTDRSGRRDKSNRAKRHALQGSTATSQRGV